MKLFLYRHAFLILAAILVAVVTASVPQVRHLLWQHVHGWQLALFLALLSGYGTLLFTLCPRVEAGTDPFTADARLQPARDRQPPKALQPKLKRERIASWAVLLLVRFGPRARKRWIALLVGLAVSWIVVPPLFDTPPLPFLEDGSRLAMAMVMLGIVVWLFLMRDQSDKAALHANYRLVVAGRALGSLLLTYVTCELAWSVLPLPQYTLFALLQMAFMALLLARLVDELHVFSGGHLRLGAAIAVVVATTLSGPEPVGRTGDDPGSETETTQWLQACLRRLDAMPEGPAVVVAASGGGSRAAMFSALVYDLLASTPLAEGNTANPRMLADNVLWISSVSGGSLASAYFVKPAPADAQEATLDREDLLPRMLGAARRACKKTAEVGAGTAANPVREALRGRAQELVAELEHAAATGGAVPEPLAAMFRSPAANAMAADFMAPLCRGVLLPCLERGTSLARYWRQRYAWAAVTNRAVPDPETPLLLLNTTDAARGTRVAIGFPPLPRGLLGDLTHSLEDLQPGHRLDLADAVRLSANFPWGLQIAAVGGKSGQLPLLILPPATGDIEPTHPLPLEARSEILLLDGGVVDNNGLDTLALLFQRLERLAMAGAAAPGKTAELATRIVERLRQHHVLIVEIDSGAKFGTEGLVAKFFSTSYRPVQAIGAAGVIRSMVAREQQLAAIRRVMRHDEAGVGQTCLSVRLSCNSFDDVMTAWALGSDDKAQVLVEFLIDARLKQPHLQAALSALRGSAAQEPDLQPSIDTIDQVRQMQYQEAPERRIPATDAELKRMLPTGRPLLFDPRQRERQAK